MKTVEAALQQLISQAEDKGYTISTARVTWTHKLQRANIRIKITPFPDLDDRRSWGGYMNTVSGSIETIENFVKKLEVL